VHQFELINYIAPVLSLTFYAFILRRAARKTQFAAQIIVYLWIFVFAVHGLVAAFEIVPLFPMSLSGSIHLSLSAMLLSFCIFISTIIFSSFKFSFSTFGPQSKSNTTSRHMAKATIWVIALFSALVLAATYLGAVRITGTMNVLGSLQYLRTQLNYEGANWGGIQYLSSIVMTLSIYIFLTTRTLDWRYRIPAYTILASAFCIAIVSTQRTTIFMLIIALVFSCSKRGIPSIKILSILAAILFSFFVLVGTLVAKIVIEEDGTGTVISAGFDAFLLYLLTPLSAFDNSLIWQSPYYDAGYTLRFFQAVISAFGIYIGETRSLVMDFIYTPLPVNTYTFAYTAIADFGYFSPIYYCAIGLILGLIFSLPRQNSAVRTLQGISYYPILMTPFQDQFFTLTSQWIQVILAVYLCDTLSTRRSYNPTRSVTFYRKKFGTLHNGRSFKG